MRYIVAGLVAAALLLALVMWLTEKPPQQPPPRPWLDELLAQSKNMNIGTLTNIMLNGTKSAVCIDVTYKDKP